jgi:hypothetical protein
VLANSYVKLWLNILGDIMHSFSFFSSSSAFDASSYNNADGVPLESIMWALAGSVFFVSAVVGISIFAAKCCCKKSPKYAYERLSSAEEAAAGSSINREGSQQLPTETPAEPPTAPPLPTKPPDESPTGNPFFDPPSDRTGSRQLPTEPADEQSTAHPCSVLSDRTGSPPPSTETPTETSSYYPVLLSLFAKGGLQQPPAKPATTEMSTLSADPCSVSVLPDGTGTPAASPPIASAVPPS